MKKVVRSIAVVALMFVAATGLAKEPKLNVTPSLGKSVSFEMESTSIQKTVNIIDGNEQVIYSDKIEASSLYSKRFDFSKLPEGDYFLKIEDSLKVTVYKLVINKSDVIVGERKENVKPVFRTKDGKLFVNLLNLDKEEVKIKVVDSEGRIVFQEIIKGEAKVEKVFNFQDAYENTYTILVEDKNDTYYEEVVVK